MKSIAQEIKYPEFRSASVSVRVKVQLADMEAPMNSASLPCEVMWCDVWCVYVCVVCG